GRNKPKRAKPTSNSTQSSYNYYGQVSSNNQLTTKSVNERPNMPYNEVGKSNDSVDIDEFSTDESFEALVSDKLECNQQGLNTNTNLSRAFANPCIVNQNRSSSYKGILKQTPSGGSQCGRELGAYNTPAVTSFYDLTDECDDYNATNKGSKWTDYFSSQSSTASECLNSKYPARASNNQIVMKNCDAYTQHVYSGNKENVVPSKLAVNTTEDKNNKSFASIFNNKQNRSTDSFHNIFEGLF
ncbi:hypothetical protein MAR_013014, partial [Mya arenaria]